MLLSSGFGFVDIFISPFSCRLIKKTIHSHLAVHLFDASCCFKERSSQSYNNTRRMKLRILALFSILASGAYALAVDPCLVCRDGATAGDDFAPFATDGLNASCADLIEEIKVIESESETCLGGSFEDVRSMCCPGTPLEDPCIICSGGITAGDDFAPSAKFDGDPTTCKLLVDGDYSAAIGAGSESCAYSQDSIEPFCCPTTPENPCIICPDGATADDGFVPFAKYDGVSTTCKEFIDYYKLIEKGSEKCNGSQHVEGHCCPTTLENW